RRVRTYARRPLPVRGGWLPSKVTACCPSIPAGYYAQELPKARALVEQLSKRSGPTRRPAGRAGREGASVPIPEVAGLCRTLGCELRNQRDTTSIMLLVSRFGSSLHFAARSRANFRIKATLASI